MLILLSPTFVKQRKYCDCKLFLQIHIKIHFSPPSGYTEKLFLSVHMYVWGLVVNGHKKNGYILITFGMNI